MNKKLKKLVMAFFAFVLFTGLAGGSNLKAEAASKNLKANKWYTGWTDGTNRKTYTFTMPESGYFIYQVIPYTGGYYYDGNYQDSTSYQVYTSMTADYKAYVDGASATYKDRGFKSGRYAFSAGTKVKFTVWDGNYYRTKYKIRVLVRELNNFETENNNTRKKADELKVGKTYRGLIMEGDTDWYVFKAPKTGKYMVRIVHTGAGTSSNFDTVVYKDSAIVSSQSIRAGSGYYTIFKGKLKKGAKIYIKNTQDYYYNFFYRLKVSTY